jgi:hypothetical protein
MSLPNCHPSDDQSPQLEAQPLETPFVPTAHLAALLRGVETQRREAEEWHSRVVERSRRRQQVRGRLERAFEAVESFPAEQNQLAKKPSAQGFRQWAERFIALTTVLREHDVSSGTDEFHACLVRVAQSGVPAFACAATLILSGWGGCPEEVAHGLEAVYRHPPLRAFVTWLPYLLDNLYLPEAGPEGIIQVEGPPDGVSFAEYRQAEAALLGWRAAARCRTDAPDREGPGAGAESVPDPPVAPQEVLDHEIEHLNQLHRLAGRCLNALLSLHHLRLCGDGDRHGHAALIELRDAVAALPPLPLAEDPFCRDEVITVAGVDATSAHAALWALAEQTWQGTFPVSLGPKTATQHAEEAGTPYSRVTQKVVRRAPTEVTWSVDVWRDVCAALEEQPAPEAGWFQAALTLERNQAARHLEERFGVLVTATRTLRLEPLVEIVQAAVTPDRPPRDQADGTSPQDARKGRKRTAAKGSRDRKLEARDKWLYRQCCNGVPYKDIKSQLEEQCRKKGWRKIGSVQGVRAAAIKYGARHHLPAPPNRQNL